MIAWYIALFIIHFCVVSVQEEKDDIIIIIVLIVVLHNCRFNLMWCSASSSSSSFSRKRTSHTHNKLQTFNNITWWWSARHKENTIYLARPGSSLFSLLLLLLFLFSKPENLLIRFLKICQLHVMYISVSLSLETRDFWFKDRVDSLQGEFLFLEKTLYRQ